MEAKYGLDLPLAMGYRKLVSHARKRSIHDLEDSGTSSRPKSWVIQVV